MWFLKFYTRVSSVAGEEKHTNMVPLWLRTGPPGSGEDTPKDCKLWSQPHHPPGWILSEKSLDTALEQYLFVYLCWKAEMTQDWLDHWPIAAQTRMRVESLSQSESGEAGQTGPAWRAERILSGTCLPYWVWQNHPNVFYCPFRFHASFNRFVEIAGQHE